MLQRLRTLLLILGAYALAVLAFLLYAWMWPRTVTGWLLVFGAGPLFLLLIDAGAEGLSWLGRRGEIGRFHEWLERRTKGNEISGLRIVVATTDIVVCISVLVGAWLLLRQTVPGLAEFSTSAGDFLRRHFY